MEEKQEGILLETMDSNEEGIVLPTVDENDETVDTSPSTSPEEETDTQSNTETDEEKESLKRALNAERKARKKAEKENSAFEARLKALEDANKEPEKSTLDGLLESGIDENIAKSIASAIDKKKSNNDNSDLKKELAEIKFESSIAKKSREEGFEDIAEYSDEIKELVDKGLTLEQSYYAVTYNKSKNTKSEIERKVEAKMQNTNARKEILGSYNNTSGGVSNSKEKIQLTAEERAIASLAGLSPEEYAAVRKADNIKDYNKYNAAKKK